MSRPGSLHLDWRHSAAAWLSIVLLAGLITLVPAPASGVNGNLVTNGDFSLGAPGGSPDHWVPDAFTGGSIHTWDQDAGTVAISSPTENDAWWRQTVTVEHDTDYVLSGEIKTQGVAHNPGVDAGANLSILDAVPGLFTFSDPLFGDHDWTHREVFFNSGDNDVVRVALRVGMFAGTTTGTAMFRNIRLDRLPETPIPMAGFSFPMAGFSFGEDLVGPPTTVWGRAIDDVGVTSVKVAIMNRTIGKWLQPDGSFGSFHRFEAALSRPASQTTDWTYSAELPLGAYSLSVRAFDDDGNSSSLSPWRHFDVVADGEPAVPTAGFGFGGLLVGPPIELFGSATDNIGVVSVKVAVRDRDTGEWLHADGTFGPFERFEADLSDPGATHTGWSHFVDVPEGDYSLSVRAFDAIGNSSSISPWHHFTIGPDTIPPVPVAGFPYGKTLLSLGAPVTLWGTATDNVAVASVKVAIRDRTTGMWLRPDGTFGSFHRFTAELSDPGAMSTDWQYEVELAEGDYSMSVRAWDAAGNTMSLSPWHHFTVRDEAPSWEVLVLIYANTDFTYTDTNGQVRHVVASLTQAEINKATAAATVFFEEDVQVLTSGMMSPTLTIRYPDRAITDLALDVGPGPALFWAHRPAAAPELDPSFDSFVVIWASRGTDVNTGEAIKLERNQARAGGGLTETYAALASVWVRSDNQNLFKHEWGHSILGYHHAAGTSPRPTIDNHIPETVKGSGISDKYVHCGTGERYLHLEEPIPGAIYHNENGFTHDYYSGTTALIEDPDRCLGIGPMAWAEGGPVTKP